MTNRVQMASLSDAVLQRSKHDRCDLRGWLKFFGLNLAWVRAWLLISLITLLGHDAVAGQQRYEPMAASVRSALALDSYSHDVPEPYFESVALRDQWLADMSARLPKRWKPTQAEREEFLLTVRYEAQRAGLDPSLVLGVIHVESYFRRYAVSSADARGYMQVMPFWARLIGDGNESRLFEMRTNLRYGCTILRYYIDRENGNLFRALGRYNGSLGRAKYPNKILRAWKRWSFQPEKGASSLVADSRG
ncbi:MAG: lytic transglycosylase domain-containing protein [Burkholderiaceae bacterium]